MRAVAKTFSDLACTLAIAGILGGTVPVVAQQSESASAAPPSSAHANQAATTAAQNAKQPILPDSPGVVRSATDPQPPQAMSDNSLALLEQAAGQSGSAPPQSSSSQAPSAQKPVGTAAAEAPNVNAITGSQPAGVAIAPAKQRRVRTIILKTGAIVGAAVAIGAIVALTAATPPKPPGAH